MMYNIAFSDPRIPVWRPSILGRPFLSTKSCRAVSGFRVVSYNLLADMYVKTGRESYDHCPKGCLSWEYRRKNILDELIKYKADVLCLQEVQSDHFLTFFQPELANEGYAAVYQPRKSQLYNGENHVSDGCATFFKVEKFKLVRSHTIEYAKLADKISENDRKNRMRKDNLAIVVILEENAECGSRLCVANTHLSSGKNLSDVRRFQAESLLKGLKKMDSLGFPVLVCGDMNSEPNTDVHNLLTENILESAYEKFPQEHKDHRDDTLDYIMYSKGKVELDGVFKFPGYESKGKMRQLPTKNWSSDHIALVADFTIKKPNIPKNVPIPREIVVECYWRGIPVPVEKFYWRNIPIPKDPWDEVEPMKKTGQPYYPKAPRASAIPWAPDYSYGPAVRTEYFIPIRIPC